MCRTAAQARAAAPAILIGGPAALALPPQRAVMVERYLPGQEYSAEMLDGQVIGITAKHLGAHPYFVETGHDFPAPLARDRRSALSAAAQAAVSALGLGWGPAHVELRYGPAGSPRWPLPVSPGSS